MDRESLMKIRCAMVMAGCPHCRSLCEFIEKMNSNLPINKRIKVIDCYNYQTYGIIDDYLIRFLKKYFDGYPTIFIDGQKIDGLNTRIEIEAFLKSRLINDFIHPYEMDRTLNGKEIPLRFEKECKLNKKWFGFKVECK